MLAKYTHARTQNTGSFLFEAYTVCVHWDRHILSGIQCVNVFVRILWMLRSGSHHSVTTLYAHNDVETRTHTNATTSTLPLSSRTLRTHICRVCMRKCPDELSNHVDEMYTHLKLTLFVTLQFEKKFFHI